MSKEAYDKIASGLKEAVAIARGEAVPAKSFIPLGNHAVGVALKVASRQLRDLDKRLEAANKLMADQNRLLAKAHAALQLAFEHQTTASPVVMLKQMHDVLAELEGRKQP
jgi:hypothetical protein